MQKLLLKKKLQIVFRVLSSFTAVAPCRIYSTHPCQQLFKLLPHQADGAGLHAEKDTSKETVNGLHLYYL